MLALLEKIDPPSHASSAWPVVIDRLLSCFCLFALLTTTARAEGPAVAVEPVEIGALAVSPVLTADLSPAIGAGHAPQRLFGILPNHQATDAPSKYVHPSVKEKFRIAQSNAFDWPNYLLNVGFALQTQVAQNGFHQSQFGKNFTAYYARTWADGIIGAYVTQAALPSLLGEDPRYIRKGVGSTWKRFGYAVSRVAVTRGTNGRNRIYLSSLAGSMVTMPITNLYYPDAHQNLSSSAERWALGLGNDVIANLLTEFLPDIQRKFRRHH